MSGKNDQKTKFKDEIKKSESPEKKLESAQKKAEQEASKNDQQDNKSKAPDASKDLIVAEEKFEEGVGLKDYLNFFSFTIGCWALLIYAIISIISALLQLAPSYFLVIWSAMTLEK